MKGVHNAVELYEVTATIRLAYTKTLLATLKPGILTPPGESRIGPALARRDSLSYFQTVQPDDITVRRIEDKELEEGG